MKKKFMPKTKVVSVRLQSLVDISAKAYKATAFDGSTAILPKSQVFGQDYDVVKSDAYWIAEWILAQKDIQYSDKKVAWFNTETNRLEPNIIVEHHKPERIEATETNPHESLTR
jgi:hypothetical protein